MVNLAADFSGSSSRAILLAEFTQSAPSGRISVFVFHSEKEKRKFGSVYLMGKTLLFTFASIN